MKKIKKQGDDWDLLHEIADRFGWRIEYAREFKKALKVKKEIDKDFKKFVKDNGLILE